MLLRVRERAAGTRERARAELRVMLLRACYFSVLYVTLRAPCAAALITRAAIRDAARRRCFFAQEIAAAITRARYAPTC